MKEAEEHRGLCTGRFGCDRASMPSNVPHNGSCAGESADRGGVIGGAGAACKAVEASRSTRMETFLQ